MRILMVAPYPPHRDGIARYALQSVARLRAEGHDVEVLSPYPSAAHHHLDLTTRRGALALARRVRGYDRVIVQFHPDMFFAPPYNPAQRARQAAALTVAWRAAHGLEIRVHEVNYRWGRGPGIAPRVVRAMWRAVPRIVFHTEAERSDFAEAFGVPMSRLHVAAHGEHFLQRTTMDREGARESLGVDPSAVVFLSIGFIQEHKGFDRAVRAFARLAPSSGPPLRLDIVGSVRLDDPAQAAYVGELRRLVRRTKRAHLHEGFVTDEMFDRWLVACDVIVLPYRHIWSSGVLERARLYGKPVIASRTGGLAEQAAAGSTLVTDDAELERAMRRAAEAAGASFAASDGGGWPAPAEATREEVEREIRERAARIRGTRVTAPEARAGTSSATAPLRRMAPLGLPVPASSRPFVVPVKRAVQRLTAWELQPLVEQLNHLQQSVLETLESLAASQATTRERDEQHHSH